MSRSFLSLASLLATPFLASCITGEDAADMTPTPASADNGAYEGRPEIAGEERRGMFRINGEVQELTYLVKGDKAFLDGDIEVPIGAKEIEGVQQAHAVTDLSDTWVGGTVPYSFASDVHENYRKVIRAALAVWEANTPLKFVVRTTQSDYIQFSGTGTGCSSLVGRQGGMQVITLEGINTADDSGCGSQRTVMHEVGHAIGLFHEQSRPDRHAFLNVMTSNMEAGKTSQVAIHPEGQSIGAYSFASVMQYGTFAFSKTDNPVLERKGVWSVRYGGSGGWQTLRTNAMNDVTTRALLIGDLDGNGRVDGIKHDSTGVWWIPNMAGNWQLRNASSIVAGELATGDWNNDGKDDLITVSSGMIRVAYSGSGPFYPVAPTTVPTSWMRFCDFNGDGRTDAFRADNGQWSVHYSGQSGWTSLGAHPQVITNLRFADVNNDGSCDVYGHNTDPSWLLYSASATEPMVTLPHNPATFFVGDRSVAVDKAIHGDFDGDGQIEVLGKKLTDTDDPAYTYQIASKPSGPEYTSLAIGAMPDPSYLKVADVNGDGRDDLLMTGVIQLSSTLAPTDIETVNKMYSSQWQVSYSGSGMWNTLNLSGYAMDQLAFGDFDGNGKTDVFRTDGTKWWVSDNGSGGWKHVMTSGYPMSRLKFADFDGDGTCDVFLIADGKFLVSWGARTAYEQINASGVTNVQVGDLNGDNKADVFTAWSGRWYASWGGTTGWSHINTSGVTPENVRLHDFNGDGRADVFHADGSSWKVSYSGTSGWSTLNTSGYEYDVLRFGDFDGNGTTDVLAMHGRIVD